MMPIDIFLYKGLLRQTWTLCKHPIRYFTYHKVIHTVSYVLKTIEGGG